MADVILFAPQMPSVQKAFCYGGDLLTAEIEFSLSEFNKDSEYTHLNYRIIDPSRSANWGTDSIIKDKEIQISKPTGNKFEIRFTSSLFETLTVNQYYQIQIQLVNGENKSAWSQASLLRPIPVIDLTNTYIEQTSPLLTLDRISGQIAYQDGTEIEAIKSYVVEARQGGVAIETSGEIINTLGTKFATYLPNFYLPDGTYSIVVNYTTINGFNSSITKEIAIGINTDDYTEGSFAAGTEENPTWKVENDFSTGSALISFIPASSLEFNNKAGKITVQKSSDKDGFLNWRTVAAFETDNIANSFKCRDFLIEGETVYKYRIIIEVEDDKKYYINKYEDKELSGYVCLEDVHLLDAHQQLTIRYNPVVSNFKYVTQEALTNTLGGRFPLVRVNGDTRYRQFTLSGLLSFKSDFGNLPTQETDSQRQPLSNWFKDENSTLLFDIDTILKKFTGPMLETLKASPGYLEKKYREIAMAFLTDQRPKLFKGAEEDNMIVYLSGVSFTPNKSLGRQVWEFSCTVTEICEYTDENLIKYGLLKSNRVYSLAYLLRMNQTSLNVGGVTLITDYVTLGETINGIPILHTFWKDIDKEEVTKDDLSLFE